MSYQQRYPLDVGKHRIISLDADEHGNYLALLDNGEVWSNHWQLPLKQPMRHPMIRRVDDERFLLVESRCLPRTKNGHLFSASGKLLLHFEAGDAIEDAVVQAGRIVISYFDEAAGSPSPAGDILAVFDLHGQQLFGFNSSQQEFLLDCYALCPQGSDSVLFYAYTDFNLRELRLTDFQLQQWPTPPDFVGSHALSASHNNVVFWGSYADNASFYWWNRQGKVTRFGNVPIAAPIRGLGNGKFLTYDAHSFTIIDALALMREETRQRRG